MTQPYKKYSLIFAGLNFLFFLPLFFSFIMDPVNSGFALFEHYWQNDPVEIYQTFFILACAVIPIFLLIFKKYKLALMIALLPEIIIISLILFSIVVSIFKSIFI